MKNIYIKYITCFLIMLSVNATAQNKSQRITINPELILLAQTRAPYTDEISRIDYVWALQEKAKTLYYPASADFFTENESKVGHTKPKGKGNRLSTNTFKKKKHDGKQPLISNSAVTVKKESDKISVNPKDVAKINGALKIPSNSKALKAKQNTASFGPNASEIREMAFNKIKKENPELEQKSVEKQQRGKNLMWAGLVLVVLGGIMGFIFGRSAFLISLAGVVFAGIGYFFRI